jgi:hypothetical protein
MAGTAELLEEINTYPIPMPYDIPVRRLQAVNQEMLDAVALIDLSVTAPGVWLSADEIPTLQAVREQSDTDAQRILAERQDLLNEGEFDRVPYAFDVLSTARKLIDIEQRAGKQSAAYQRTYAGFQMDIRRHGDEARRRLTWEFFPEIEQPYDAEADSYRYGDYVLKEVVTNGLTPVGADEVGVETLVANYREEFTGTAVGKLGQLMLQYAGV